MRPAWTLRAQYWIPREFCSRAMVFNGSLVWPRAGRITSLRGARSAQVPGLTFMEAGLALLEVRWTEPAFLFTMGLMIKWMRRSLMEAMETSWLFIRQG